MTIGESIMPQLGKSLHEAANLDRESDMAFGLTSASSQGPCDARERCPSTWCTVAVGCRRYCTIRPEPRISISLTADRVVLAGPVFHAIQLNGGTHTQFRK